jgi:hypothetical protein
MAGAEVLRFLAARPEVTDTPASRQVRYGRNRRGPRRCGWHHRCRRRRSAEVRYHVVAQWLVDRQLAELGQDAAPTAGCLARLAIGTHPDGYDLATPVGVRHPGERGAPAFFVAGQDQFPPLV